MAETYPEEANLKILNHPNLDTTPRFSELKSMLGKFYQDRRRPFHRQKMHKTRTLRWKESIYNSLQCLMGELTFTHDPVKQESLLGTVYDWYKSKVKDGSELPRIVRSPAPTSSTCYSRRPSMTPEPSSVPSVYIPKPLKASYERINSR